jgi:acyl-CoA thioester hydrolase
VYKVELQVRDYECDMQGIVNNAIYQHYFEHARHSFLHAKGLDFFEVTKKGILLVIYRSEIDYIIPLSHNQSFKVSVEFERLTKIKALFKQKIFINNEVFTEGKFYITALNSKKKPINLDELNLNSLCIN